MNYPLITCQHAEQFNEKVKKMSPELFWTCNYQPTSSFAINEDAKFLSSIQDLYKFVIDTGGMMRRFGFIVSTCPPRLTNRAQDIINHVELLRHNIDHNTNPLNGTIEKQREEEFLRWIRSVISKEIPETNEDFSLLNASLAKTAEDALSVSNEMINHAIAVSRNKKTIDKWREEIIKWYCNPTHFDVYEGQLLSAYLSRAIASRPNISMLPLNEQKKCLADWVHIRSYKLHEQSVQLKKSIEFVELQLPKCKADQRATLQNEYLPNLQRQLHALEEETKLYDCSRRKFDSYRVFRNHLSNQLQETLSLLLREEREFSMLPQDFIQEDIERIFNGIPICD